MLNEGIDVQEIDSVMLFRRTESPRIYFQQIGRSIRKHGVETPLIFDCVLNFQNVNVNFIEESKKEFSSYRKKLEQFGFKDIDVPKTIHVHDELQSISKIIDEVEKRLNFYPTYEEAKQSVKKLRISFPSEYIKRFIVDPRLPSNPSIYYKEKGWIDFYEFLGRKTPDFYPTYEEAKEAVKKLEINQKDEYLKRYKEDPRLPSAPSATYKGKGWIGWPDYFGREAPDFYPTYEEAKEAVKKLGISLRVEYSRLYKEDTRLPCEPNEKYEDKGWIDWHDYLGKEALYKTYKEAKQAVKKLGITSNLEYRKTHEKDQRLPTNPDRVYKKRGWIDGYDFFGKQKAVLYHTIKEAKQAVNKLGISSQTEYGKRYKEDPMLPSSPSWIYTDKGWIDWHDYLGNEAPYKTYKEAKQAAMKLGISSLSEYKKRYKEDPRLPCEPNEKYKEKGWIDQYDFFEKQTPVEKYETYV